LRLYKDFLEFILKRLIDYYLLLELSEIVVIKSIWKFYDGSGFYPFFNKSALTFEILII